MPAISPTRFGRVQQERKELQGSLLPRPVHPKDRALFELIDRVLDEYDRSTQSTPAPETTFQHN
jgi:hypothetical protein